MAKKRHTRRAKKPDIQAPDGNFCGAWIEKKKKHCERPAGWGTSHAGRGRCKWHGGATPSHVAKAQREAAREALIALDIEPADDVDPTIVLLEEIQRSRAWVLWLHDDIVAMEPEALTFGVFKESARTADADGGGQVVERQVERRAGITAKVRLYQEERRHLHALVQSAIVGGIAERQVRIAEHQAAIFATALRGILADLGVADHPDVGKIVRRHMTIIDGGRAA